MEGHTRAGSAPGQAGAARFVGRADELEAFDRALAQASDGRPTVVLIVGEAGMGKTKLVQETLRDRDVLVATAAGDPVEADLDYGLVDQLLRDSRLDADTVGATLPGEGTDPLEAGAALLRLVDGLQLGLPLVVAIDDAHWADRPSLDALTFAARRLRADRVLLCVATRPEGVDRLPRGLMRLVDTGGVRIDLGPLDAAAVRELARHTAGRPIAAGAAERLRAHTAGNPLHLRALLRELTPEALDRTGPLPAPRSYATLVLGRLAACSDAAQRLVAALAILGPRAPLATVAATAGLDDPLEPLDEVVDQRLVELVEQLGDRSIAFTHPLVQAAVFDDLAPSRRAALHRAAGAVVSGPAGLRHRLAGCPGFDEHLAGEAADVAAAEARRGAHASAARLWMEAARLAPDTDRRDEAVLTAIDQMLLAGDMAGARERRHVVDSATVSPLRLFLQGRLAYVLGPRAEAARLLEQTWSAVVGSDGEPEDPVLAGRTAALLATCAVDRADGETGLQWARRALVLARAAAADCNHGHMLAMSSALVGRVREGIAELSAALADPPDNAGAVADLRLGRGVLRLWAHDVAGAGDDLAACLAAWGSGATFVSRETARFFLAELHYRAGRWDDALVTAEVAASIVDETDQLWLAAFSHAVAVHPLAGRGEWTRASAHLAAARAAAKEMAGGAAGLWTLLASIRLAESQADHARVVAGGDVLIRHQAPAVDEGIAPWRGGYVEALLAVGRPADARVVGDRLVDDTAGTDSALVRAEVARARVALALAAGDDDALEAAAAEGLAGDPTAPGPFARARLELAVGRAWRQRGDRRRGVELLDAARARFADLRAMPWTDRTDQELAATGLRAAGRRSATGAELTAQEQAVCHLVAKGRTNRETAAELYLSVKTVEHHLSRAYAKLGVRSRTALGRALTSDQRRESLAGTP
ncbi:MAG TPA: AAA family ATPase [Acidimicrobiales bacterium]|nr:AAA family ATPase [Acidimicrobiales bacterium]